MDFAPPTTTSSSPQGLVLEILRMSTEDGPGLRTTVFLKGCPLNCRWCHNPESLSRHPEIQWIASRCMGCRTCENVCERKALEFASTGLVIRRERCIGCGTCAKACPTTAMELLGTRWTVQDLVRELVKDRAYYHHSRGGVTLSGGEPTLQASFVEALAREFGREGVVQVHDEACLTGAQRAILEAVEDSQLGGVVLATGSPHYYENSLHRSTIGRLRAAGINPNRIAFANLSRQVAMPHRGDPEGATNKARMLIEVAIEKVRPMHELRIALGGGIGHEETT